MKQWKENIELRELIGKPCPGAASMSYWRVIQALKRSMYMLFTLCLLAACGSKGDIDLNQFTAVSLKELHQHPEKYQGKLVKVEAFILGVEYDASENDKGMLIFVLGDRPQPKQELAKQIYFPEYEVKIRAAEDGYNHSVIKSCEEIVLKARRRQQSIVVYGEMIPQTPFFHYEGGVDMVVAGISYDQRTVNSDYNDVSKVAHDTPGVLSKLYKYGKKAVELAKKLRP